MTSSKTGTTATVASHPRYELPIAEHQRARAALKGKSLVNILPHTWEAGDAYYIGDVYAPPRPQPWNIPDSSMPYLRHIKEMSPAWPDVKYLADWMEVSTSPVKWKFIQSEPSNIQMRAKRTKVAMIDLSMSGKPTRHNFNSSEELFGKFNDPKFSHNPAHARLYVVEDLSRDMIEAFGAQYDIDPLFFRDQISDYLWYNTRDPWVEMTDLPHTVDERNYYTVRYMTSRYFQEKSDLDTASIEAGSFNVLRRLDHDRSYIIILDKKNAAVALVRSKASLWIRKNKSGESGVVGILLVDPTLTVGSPLWGGYRTLSPSPSMHHSEPIRPPRSTLFEEVIYYTMNMSAEDIKTTPTQPYNLGLAILSIVGAEWLAVVKYLTTRLTQIEWELEHPDFRTPPFGLDGSLKRLHPWRRSLPVYRTMVNEVLESLLGDTNIALAPGELLSKLQFDFKIILGQIDRIDRRIEGMINVATAIINIEDNKRATKQNKDLSRLTYLAVIFVPMSFTSSFFSMTPDLSLLTQTIWIYFAVSIPLTLIALGVAVAGWTHVVGGFRWCRENAGKLLFWRKANEEK